MDAVDTAVEIYGAAAVTSMVFCYARERRGSGYVLAFALACLASSSYAALIGSWPFAAVELIWAVIAFGRWQSVRATNRPGGRNDRLG
jgi:hypothetical protein